MTNVFASNPTYIVIKKLILATMLVFVCTNCSTPYQRQNCIAIEEVIPKLSSLIIVLKLFLTAI